MNLLSEAERAILTLLSVSPPGDKPVKMYLSEFVNAFSDTNLRGDRITYKHIFPLLLKAEMKRLIVGQWEDKETSSRRKYYSITKRGKQALTEHNKYFLALENWSCQYFSTESIEVDILDSKAEKNPPKVQSLSTSNIFI